MGKKTYKVDTFFGSYNVMVLLDKYFNNRNLAIQLFDPNDGPFATLTVNLSEKLPGNMAFVDTNNCPWAEKFIQDNGLGKFAGRYGMSGWCTYPLYEFNVDALKGA